MKTAHLEQVFAGWVASYHLLHPRLASSLFRFLLYSWFVFLSSPYVIHWPSFQAWVYCGTFLTTSCSTLSYRQQGEEMGQTLHTFTALAHNHKYTQEVTDKGGMATRDRERERCVCECARESEREKKRQWAATNMSGQCGTNITSSDSVHSDTQSAIVTHSHASRDIFFPQQRPHAHRVAHTYMQICVQTHFGREQRASADTNTDTQLNKQTHARWLTQTHTRVSHLSRIVFACWLCSIHHTMTASHCGLQPHQPQQRNQWWNI